MDNKIYPLISIGLPTFNRPEGLKKALMQLCNQTYSNIEIIISDNCSPNLQVQEIANSFNKSDLRVKYFRQTKNIGMFDNFRFVLNKSSGKYFMWASDDDEFDKFCIEKLQLLLLFKSFDFLLLSFNCSIFKSVGFLFESLFVFFGFLLLLT